MPLRIVINYGRQTETPLEVENNDRPMGGIISAAFGLSHALARRGHDVHLFAPCKNPGTYHGVRFHHRREFARFTECFPPDALVLIPEVLPILLPVRARSRIVWTGNAQRAGDVALTVEPSGHRSIGRVGQRVRLYAMAQLHPYVDRVVVGSRWHAERLQTDAGIPASKLTVRYLGVPLEYYRGPALRRHPHRVVYTSQARRGLSPLLGLFPRIRQAFPDAELHVYGYECAEPPMLRNSTPVGVFWHGCLSKSDLAVALRSAGLLAYPTNFRETFCLAVAEGQAAGLPVVTSARAALVERVDNGVDGYLIARRTERPAFQDAFVNAVLNLLSDGDSRDRMGVAAARKAHTLYDWDEIARQWESDLERLVAGRPAEAVSPDIDLLDPDLLVVTNGTESVRIPPRVAAQWLCEARASYGYGTPPRAALRRPPGPVRAQ